jgi:hypothetical protein
MKEVQDTDAETMRHGTQTRHYLSCGVSTEEQNRQATLMTAESRRRYNRNVRKQGFGL